MPIKVKPKKSKRGIRVKIEHHNEEGGFGVKEVFIGHHTVFSLIGYTVGGILVGRSIWQYSQEVLGLPYTILLGLLIFAVSGIISGQFGDKN